MTTPSEYPAAMPYGALPKPASELGQAARRADAAWGALLQRRAQDEYAAVPDRAEHESLAAALSNLAAVAASEGVDLEPISDAEYACVAWHLAAGHFRAIAKDAADGNEPNFPPDLRGWADLPIGPHAWYSSVPEEDSE